MTPFYDNSQPVFENVKIFTFFSFKLLLKMFPNLYFTQKIDQNLSNSDHLTPFWGLLIEWPPFSEKKPLTKRLLVSSSCPSTPVASNVECPPGFISKKFTF